MIQSCGSLKPPKSFYLAHLFVDLQRDECDQLWQFGVVRHLEKEEAVYSKRYKDPCFVVVLKGSLKSRKENMTYEASDCFGELYILSDTPSTSDIVSSTNSQIFCLNQQEFSAFSFEYGHQVFKIFKSYLNHCLEDNENFLKQAS